MKTTKLTIKFFLIVSLFASITLADEGQMGGGNFGDDGQMGGGNVTCSEEQRDENGNCPTDDGNGFNNTIFESVKEYLANLLG